MDGTLSRRKSVYVDSDRVLGRVSEDMDAVSQ